MGYVGRCYITRDNYPKFKEGFMNLLEVGYKIEYMEIDNEVFKDYDSFENHLHSIKKAYRIKTKFRKNDNTIETRNQWYNKRKWNHYENIENEYDVYNEDMMKIRLKYNEFYQPIYKYSLIKDGRGYDAFADFYFFVFNLLVLRFLAGASIPISIIITIGVYITFKVLLFFRPAYRNKFKKRK